MTADRQDNDALACAIVGGVDAASFLQAQLSADLDVLASGQLCLSGWHDPQGRVRCLLWVGRVDSASWRIVTEESQLDALLVGLGRYVLRAKVTFERESDGRVGILTGSGVEPPAGASYWPLPGDGDTVLWAGPSQAVTARSGNVSGPLVAAGVPRLVPALSGQFIGQSLNLDLIGAISFSKGCFPGQEILARTHNLGKVKRRLLKFAATGAVAKPGESIQTLEGDSAGTVVSTDGAGQLLASVQLQRLQRELILGDSGTTLQLATLPYPIPEMSA